MLRPNGYKDTMKAFDNFKNKQESVWSNVFDILKYIYSESVFNALYIEIKHNCYKKFLQTKKKNGVTKALFFHFLSFWAPTYHSVTLNLLFLYELKHKVLLSKTMCGIFDFLFRFVFIKVCICVQQNARTLWL